MSTQFDGEGNIGSQPDFREFPQGNDKPLRLLRLSVYFDNPVPLPEGAFEDRGGFWAPVEWWVDEAEHWATLYQKGMRVLIQGRIVREDWKDKDDKPHQTYKIVARRIAVLPYRIERIIMVPKPAQSSDSPEETTERA
jgi:single-strand DNA-binding protein